MTRPPLVTLIDDDESVRESLPDLLGELGFAVQTFSSAEQFLDSDFVGRTEVLILDVAMPGMNGLELQKELARRRHRIPIVFVTGNRDEAIRSEAMQAGAVEFLFKPFSDTDLLTAVRKALRAA